MYIFSNEIQIGWLGNSHLLHVRTFSTSNFLPERFSKLCLYCFPGWLLQEAKAAVAWNLELRYATHRWYVPHFHLEKPWNIRSPWIPFCADCRGILLCSTQLISFLIKEKCTPQQPLCTSASCHLAYYLTGRIAVTNSSLTIMSCKNTHKN
jgi:hypothetical protein